MDSKRRVALSALGALLGFAVPTRAVGGPPFEVKSGVVVTVSYDAGGRVEETVYFDDYGRKQAAYITKTLDVGGVPRVGHELRISLPDASYYIDLDRKIGAKHWPSGGAPIGTGNDAALAEAGKVKDLPAKEFLGHKCKGTEIEAMGLRTSAWTWKGITLYSEAVLASGRDDRHFVRRAIKLTEGPVPAEKFQIPADANIRVRRPE